MRALSRCVACSADEFAARVWGQRPLLTRAAELPRDFTDLLSPAMVDEIIAERGVRTPFVRMAREGTLVDRACFTRSAGFGAQIADQLDPDGVLTQFAAGATIVLQGLHRFWPPIIDFVRGITSDVGHPVQTNAYITPPANRGFDPHYDVHDVFVLQVSGTKRWRVHEPVHRHPLPDQPWTDHREAIAERSRDEPVTDAVLEPGDCLYLPRGWVHSAEAQGDTSIHLTVGVAPLTGYDMARAVIEALASEEELRASLPFGLAPADAARAEPQAREVLDVLARLIEERREELSDLSGDSLAKKYLDLTRPAAIRPLATLDAVDSLHVDTPLRWRDGLHGSIDESGSDTVVLRLPTKAITFPAICAPALRAAMTGDPVTAGVLPGLDEADGLVVLRRLLREAVLVAL
ncbi:MULTISPECIES: cupin domain-containing protein [unclassified Dietzia]|uniref:cupin domain-containing protein n=1 Tax=unclassified Dietzia TaxID=2617939 RepID=UPI000D21591F|nr:MULTISPECIES: cupin domain-containing protein [unclassified Dietzia]AVZ38451.1 cupin [Dietzia sp. JS16-p6b]QGW23489.1 cupin 4 family protein [Dietzia sp. DQ12-45-1b]